MPHFIEEQIKAQRRCHFPKDTQLVSDFNVLVIIIKISSCPVVLQQLIKMHEYRFQILCRHNCAEQLAKQERTVAYIQSGWEVYLGCTGKKTQIRTTDTEENIGWLPGQ